MKTTIFFIMIWIEFNLYPQQTNHHHNHNVFFRMDIVRPGQNTAQPQQAGAGVQGAAANNFQQQVNNIYDNVWFSVLV